MTAIYRVTKADARHSCLGTYVDVSGCFELPVGPFGSRAQASDFVIHNAERLIELYGPQAAEIATAATQP